MSCRVIRNKKSIKSINLYRYTTPSFSSPLPPDEYIGSRMLMFVCVCEREREKERDGYIDTS